MQSHEQIDATRSDEVDAMQSDEQVDAVQPKEHEDSMDVDRHDSMSPGKTKSSPPLPSANDEEHVGSVEDVASMRLATTQLKQEILETLRNISPETLASFLDPMSNTFKAVTKGDKQLVIWRKGIEVFVGTFEHHRSCKLYGFEHVAGFLIGYDGVWHLKVTAANAYSNPKWNDVWTGKFESFGGLAKMVIDTEAADMAKRASEFAQSIFNGQYWTVAKPDIKTT